MPQGKDSGKELCDILVVCDPDIIIFSVKEINLKDSGNISIDWQRWRKKAIDESCKQIYGAERWISTATNIITQAGEVGLPFPDVLSRRIHRVAIALGSQGKVPFYFGDFDKGFVHVFDEVSLDIVMNELDTITDFVGYLTDKEVLYEKGAMTFLTSGGEEDLLAFYLHKGRKFPDRTDLIVLDGDLWSEFTKKPEYRAKKQADKISYVWDRLIEILCENYRSDRLLSEHPYSAKDLTEVEMLIRVMVREDRFCRRFLSKKFIEFLELTKTKKVKSRVVSSLSEVNYIFLACPHSEDRKYRMAELAARCFIVRGLNPEKKLVIGIATEEYEPGKGFSLDALYLNKESWTAEDQKQLEQMQKELGYFTNSLQSQIHEDEYPSS